MDFQYLLKSFRPEHDFFIGIDSDGCVFDSMEVKQKEFFIPEALKHFGLYPVSGIVRKTWEFVNLYSIHRGGNRFTSIVKVFDLLNNNEQVRNSGVKLPDMHALKEWIKKETRLGNENLGKYLETNYDPDLEKVLVWSETVNNEIGRWLKDVPPFPHSVETLKKISGKTDIVIVSQTPLEALEREWEEHDLKKYTKVIAGQEHGTKSEHLAFLAKGKYPDDRILMIGDAKGDLDAAKNNGALFFPIVPAKEDESWEKFIKEGLPKFYAGTFSGNYEEMLVKEFLKSLPVTFPNA